MYLKHPDWDMDVPGAGLPSKLYHLLVPCERRSVAALRQQRTVAMWGDVIDGEYLDLREGGVIYHDGDGNPTGGHPVDTVSAELPDGEYRLIFRGGYDDDWEPWAAPWARLLKVRGRGQIKVKLLAVVKDQRATISIEPPGQVGTVAT